MLNPLSLIQKIVGAVILAVILSLAVALWAADRRADKWEDNARKCAEARVRDRASYEAAQAEARRMNEAEVARIEAEQQRISNETTRDLHARLERLRRELRAKPAAPQGSAGSPETGPDGKPAPRVDGEARVCLEAEELLRGAENEERHEQLIRWVEKQLGLPR